MPRYLHAPALPRNRIFARNGFCVVAVSALIVTASIAGGGVEARASGLDVLEKFSGNWNGRAKLRRGSNSKIEPVKCRIRSQWSEAARTLNMSYVCLGLDVRFESSGRLNFAQGSDRFSGSWHVAGYGGQHSVSGRLRGSRLVLSLSGKDPQSGKPVNGTFSIALSGSNMSNRLSTTDPKTNKRFQAFIGSFKK